MSEKISKLNKITSNQLKKNDSPIKLNNVNATVNTTTCASSMSSSGRVYQELTNNQPTKTSAITTDLNFKVDSTNIEVEKNSVGVLKQFNILNNGQFNFKPNDTTLVKDTVPNR